jgi:putative transposase
MILTYRYRVKSLHGELNRQARAVNYVWNYCNNVQRQALKWSKKWPSRYDLDKLTAGSCKELGLSANTISKVCHQYADSRRQRRKPFLRWRGKKSLGWIPTKGQELRREVPTPVWISRPG